MPDTMFDILPIEGEIQRDRGAVTQRPIEELAAAIQNVLNVPEITGVRWQQYTPYFMDGDPCIFGVSGIQLVLTDVPLEDDGTPREEGDFGDPHIVEYIDRPWTDLAGGPFYDRENRTWEYRPGTNAIATLYVPEFVAEINSGAHNVKLQELFGDNACVTATAEKFVVEYWEHD